MARKNVEAVQFHIPEGTRQQIVAHAEKMGFKVFSDYIRALIQIDMQSHGIDINLEVQRGRAARDEDES